MTNMATPVGSLNGGAGGGSISEGASQYLEQASAAAAQPARGTEDARTHASSAASIPAPSHAVIPPSSVTEEFSIPGMPSMPSFGHGGIDAPASTNTMNTMDTLRHHAPLAIAIAVVCALVFHEGFMNATYDLVPRSLQRYDSLLRAALVGIAALVLVTFVFRG